MNGLLRQAPNILSALRLVAAPIAAVLILEHSDVAALCVFVVAGVSDALDGFLAKRFALTSRFGAWLDPAADKLLMLASFVTLTVVGLQLFPLGCISVVEANRRHRNRNGVSP